MFSEEFSKVGVEMGISLDHSAGAPVLLRWQEWLHIARQQGEVGYEGLAKSSMSKEERNTFVYVQHNPHMYRR